MPSTITPLSAALTAAKDECGKKVATLAAQSGINDKTLYAYLRGRRVPPRDALDRLLHAMNVSAETRSRVYAAAGFDAEADPADLAADLVRSLPTMRDRRLAVELLRAQTRFASTKRGQAMRTKAEALLDEAERVVKDEEPT